MRPTPIASARHTTAVVLIFVVLGLAGGTLAGSGGVQSTTPNGSQILQLYLSILLMEWGSVYYVWVGIHRSTTLGSLVAGRWNQARDIAIDVAVAAASWLLWLSIQTWLPSPATDMQRFLPQGLMQSAAWIPVALSAGICEEIVFRGYLQRQFHAFSGSLAAAVGAQALVFAFAHFYEGAWAVARIAGYGVLLGIVAAWRRSLRPGMIAHTWSDLFGVVSWIR